MRVALYGGSFNPIHNGHLITAEFVRSEFKYDKFIFIPTGNAPHKKLTDPQVRYEMVLKAISGNPYFRVSRTEIDRDDTSYTIDTARHFRDMYEDAVIDFIIGTDTLYQLETWKDFKGVSELVNFVVMERGRLADKDRGKAREWIKTLNLKYGAEISLINSPIIEISSTDIRNRISLYESVKYLVPDEVFEIIKREGFYRYDTCEKISRLRDTTGKERTLHSMRVADLSRELAIIHGLDSEKAFIAGLYHDCGKFSDKSVLLKRAYKYGIISDDRKHSYSPILHQDIAPHIANDDYGIVDSDVIEAVGKHCTAERSMTKLDKLIYLADFIEPSRHFEGLNAIRKLAYKDIDRAFAEALSLNYSYLKSQCDNIDSRSTDAYEAFCGGLNK